MRHVVGTVFAIGVAGVAAIAATTAWINSPLRIGPPPGNPTTTTPTDPSGKPAEPNGSAKPAPADIPDAPTPGASKPAPAPEAGPATTDAAKPGEEDKEDADPYEGVAAEELPPDLQYSADSSISFPTNT